MQGRGAPTLPAHSFYHDPGGFRVANAYLLDVSRILSEEIERAAK